MALLPPLERRRSHRPTGALPLRPDTTTDLRRADPARTELGWQVWHACSTGATVTVVRADDLLRVSLTEVPRGLPGAPGIGAGRRPATTQVELDDSGGCRSQHVDSPSLLHIAHAHSEAYVVPGDGRSCQLTLALGGVLVVATASLLDALPPTVLAGLPARTERARSLAGLADDLVRRARQHPAGEGAGVVVVRRVWSAGPR